MTQVRANITTAVNAAKIRREQRNGRDVIVVPSATLPDDIVMNRIMYPADVIEAGYKTLERTPAPLNHPAVNGVYINANDPEAINGFWVGAWNENVRRENGRVHLDKVIDVARAESTEEGKRLLDAINKQKPIHTSTGLLLAVNDVEHEDYDRVATELLGDHDCFLLDQPGAATPEQGVGVFVNSSGENVEVVNSYIEVNDALPGSMEDMRRALREAVEAKYGSGFVDDFNSESLIFFQMDDEKGDTSYKIGYSVLDGQIQISDERQEVQRKTTWESVTNTIRNTLSKMFGTSPDATKATGLTANQSTGESEMTVTKEAFDALATKVDALVANAEKQPSVADQITEALKPVTDQLQANAEAEKAKAEAEKAELEATVVNAKLATAEEAQALDVNALKIMARNAAPGKKTAGIASGMAANGAEEDSWKDYDLNSNMEAK